MMDSPASWCQDLITEVEIPDDGTISKTIYQDENVKLVLFGFAAGQELSEHTASVPAILHFLEGQAKVTFGEQAVTAKSNFFLHMAAKLPHSITAITPTRMLLTLLKSAKD